MTDRLDSEATDATVSVIVPVYEVADYLDACVASIACQTYYQLEIILVDDGSRDGSGALCDRWAAADARIRVIHQENRGLSAARNTGIDVASGEFIAFVDPDDTVGETYVETFLTSVRKLGVPCVACGHTRQSIAGDTIVCRPCEVAEVVSAREALERTLTPSRGRVPVPVTAWSKLYDRTLFSDSSMRFPEGLVYEDLYTIQAFISKSGRIGLIPDVLYHKRQRPDSITSTHTAQNARDFACAVRHFVEETKAAYPDLDKVCDRYLERARIGIWHK